MVIAQNVEAAPTGEAPSDAAFRAEVRAFLEAELPAERRFTNHTLEMQTEESTRWWHKTLNAKGWGAPAWPASVGGTGWTIRQQAIFDEECAAVGAPLPSPFGTVMVGPVIYTFGSEAQKAKYLPPILDGSVLWCQGYSEPGSGSDLASLDTRAVRDGDDFVVNGQKIWTTQAQWAQWIFCLVRTSTEGRPQTGISFLLIDMTSPGIEVRPILTIDGLHHLNEVFFTDVRVPAENLVGKENEGWTYAKFLLGHERQSIAQVARSRAALKQLREYASDKSVFAEPPINDPYYLEQIVELERRVEALGALEARALAAPDTSMEAMLLSSPLKLQGSHILQDTAKLFVEIAGPGALPAAGADTLYDAAGADFMNGHLLGRAHTIYGGTSEVQKNVIGKLLANAT